jgi:hypothetical protein
MKCRFIKYICYLCREYERKSSLKRKEIADTTRATNIVRSTIRLVSMVLW